MLGYGLVGDPHLSVDWALIDYPKGLGYGLVGDPCDIRVDKFGPMMLGWVSLVL